MRLTVAITSTVPAACFGAIAVQVVLEEQLTPVAFVAPNLNTVAEPSAKPLPVIVTVVPPLVGPDEGLTPVTAGVYLKWSASTLALVPAGVVTVTSAVPPVPAV